MVSQQMQPGTTRRSVDSLALLFFLLGTPHVYSVLQRRKRHWQQIISGLVAECLMAGLTAAVVVAGLAELIFWPFN